MSARSDGVAASPEMGWMRAAAVEDCESWIVWVVLRALLRQSLRVAESARFPQRTTVCVNVIIGGTKWLETTTSRTNSGGH
jgi:hypothetical protein